MKLVRHGNPGQEKPGLVDDAGQIRDLSGVMELEITGLGRQRQQIAQPSVTQP